MKIRMASMTLAIAIFIVGVSGTAHPATLYTGTLITGALSLGFSCVAVNKGPGNVAIGVEIIQALSGSVTHNTRRALTGARSR